MRCRAYARRLPRHAGLGLWLWLAVTGGLLSGCASGEGTRWQLNGRTLSEFRAHEQDCSNVAQRDVDATTLAQAGENIGNGASMKSGTLAGLGVFMVLLEVSATTGRREDCMRGLGYTRLQ